MIKIINTKVCSKCRVGKEATKVNFFTRTNGSLHSECKICFSKRCSENARAPHRKEKSKEYNKKYRIENRAKTLLASKTSRNKKKDYYNAKERERNKDPDRKKRKKASKDKWLLKNPNYKSLNRSTVVKTYYNNNKEKILKSCKEKVFNLTDSYIKQKLNISGFVNMELLELKREQLKLKRKINEKQRNAAHLK